MDRRDWALASQLFTLRRFTARAAAPPAVVERIVGDLWRDRRPLRVRVTDEIKTPLTFVLLRPVILLRSWKSARPVLSPTHEIQ